LLFHRIDFPMYFWLQLLSISIACILFMNDKAAASDPPLPPPLKTVAIAEPSNLSEFVRDRQAAVLLGKALFWDMQVGSDGQTACATCHFNAGADSRTKNQMS